MINVAECVVCGKRLNRRPGRGRAPRYCTVNCRQDARNTVKREGRMFEYIKRHYHDMGEAEMRRKLAADLDFADDVLSIAETYLPEPDGPEAVDEIEPELVRLLSRSDRGFKVMSHDTPLPSSADIDAAETSGDWSMMVENALKSMAWQLANGFKPDLREFDHEDNYGRENTIHVSTVRSEEPT